MEAVFRALADPHRRALLDLLRERDGRTLAELDAHLPMTRFGTMKHLRLLEAAGLILTRRAGREKLHYLNPVPIRLIHDRWLSKYAAAWAGAPGILEQSLEAIRMEGPSHVYVPERGRWPEFDPQRAQDIARDRRTASDQRLSMAERKIVIGAAALKMLFGYNHFALRANTKGLSHQESLIQPEPGGNCLNWVLGHILASRNLILRHLGEPPLWSEAEAEPYRRGSQPLRDPARARPFEDLLADLDRSQERLETALDRVGDSRLGESVAEGKRGFGGGMIGAAIAGLHFHEAYHVGQTGLLRRMVGKSGAIQ